MLWNALVFAVAVFRCVYFMKGYYGDSASEDHNVLTQVTRLVDVRRQGCRRIRLSAPSAVLHAIAWPGLFAIME